MLINERIFNEKNKILSQNILYVIDFITQFLKKIALLWSIIHCWNHYNISKKCQEKPKINFSPATGSPRMKHELSISNKSYGNWREIVYVKNYYDSPSVRITTQVES